MCCQPERRRAWENRPFEANRVQFRVKNKKLKLTDVKKINLAEGFLPNYAELKQVVWGVVLPYTHALSPGLLIQKNCRKHFGGGGGYIFKI
jgi:hypothetical protein